MNRWISFVAWLSCLWPVCCKNDDIVVSETASTTWLDDEEEFWVYCKRCDCWTAHPLVRK